MYADSDDPAGPDNAVTVAGAFLAAMQEPAGPLVSQLRQLVTPESLAAWGDFSDLVDPLRDCVMTSKANSAVGDDEVVYAKYLTDPGPGGYDRATEEQIIMVRAVASMVWRPSLGGWRIHGVGDYLRPEQIPHD